MKILITGGLGFIGSHITKRLEAEGNEVVILDNFSSHLKENAATYHKKILQADITDYEQLKTLKITGSFDAVLHLAAQSSGSASFKDPEMDMKINILGTLNVIRLCGDLKIPKIIFASSFTVYGDNLAHERLSEDLPCNPQSLYGIGKLTGEHYLRVYAEKLGVVWNALRMFNVYGPGQDLSRKDQGIASIFLSYVKEGNYIPVQGSLDRFRDLVYIDDVVEAWLLCLKNNKFPNRTFNVGSGQKTLIKDLIDEIIHQYDKDVKVEVVGHTPGDVKGAYANISRISHELGYSPKYDLKKGVKSFKNWADSSGEII